jgi:hypothetical protein
MLKVAKMAKRAPPGWQPSGAGGGFRERYAASGLKMIKVLMF